MELTILQMYLDTHLIHSNDFVRLWVFAKRKGFKQALTRVGE